MKKISIIIPCYNVSDLVYDSWNSIKNQTMDLSDIECIFIDDASTDDGLTWKMLNKIEEEAPESVKIIHSDENMRQGGARNIGLQYAEGEYLMFLDADDMYRSDACMSLYQKAKAGDYDIIQSKHNMVGELGEKKSNNGKSAGDIQEKAYELSDDNIRMMFLINAIGDFGCTNKFYKMKLVKEAAVHFAEHVIYEEPLFVYPLFAYADNVLITEEAYYQYNLHEGSTMTSELGTHLMEHPYVQLLLIEDMITREDVYKKYYYAIMLHFIHSYYTETLLFARVNRGANLELSYFHEMQNICLKLFPDYKSNPILKSVSPYVQRAAESIEEKIETQEDFLQLLDDVARAAGVVA
ncbi:MAG: glycosyltransferase family 2 protein [Lachnospiraceae bacterium]|nr:glycosyltransferase family 2 protein [Lachnospiraceae bacterium]